MKLVFLSATLAVLVPFTTPHATAQSTVVLSAILLGENECNSVAPPAGPVCRVGDPDGFGTATLTFPSAGNMCVSLYVDNLAGATFAHIHLGQATFNGHIVLTLPTPTGTGNPGLSTACMPVDITLLNALRNNPGNYYVNVHNGLFPTGAIRGQLF